MKVVIIEDEKISANKLKRQLSDLYPNTEIICTLTSVCESVEWFRANPMPDLIFMDIQLSDDISFLIFDSVDISCPIIFTTAYDEYALKAFEVNSIDYLLKPIDEASLMRAMDKYNRIISSHKDNNYIDSIKSFIERYNIDKSDHYPHSILIEYRDKLIPIRVDEIAYLYFANKKIDIVLTNGDRKQINGSLDNYFKQLNPKNFYRANRQFIIARGAVKDLTVWFNCRLIVNLYPPTPERIIISRINSADFKKWLTDSIV